MLRRLKLSSCRLPEETLRVICTKDGARESRELMLVVALGIPEYWFNTFLMMAGAAMLETVLAMDAGVCEPNGPGGPRPERRLGWLEAEAGASALAAS